MKKKLLALVGVGAAVFAFPMYAFAADGPTPEVLQSAINSVWVMLAAILVIFMQAGFALLEAGSTQMKNAGHIAGKTVLMFGLSAICFWALGFGFAFGNGNDFFGMIGFFVNGTEAQAAEAFGSLSYSDVPIAIKFLFQLAFAAVSLAIACGGMAERAKLSVYLIFGAIFTIVIYPIVAHWVWGGGWLARLGMQDFAGSVVVHMQGATAALVATILLKPRIGKFSKDNKPRVIPGHNQVLSVLGVIILWVGWFGFNPGSTLSAVGDGFFGYIALTTNMAAAAGGVAALFISWLVTGKAEIPSMLNGVLAALVAITGSCAFVEPWAAVVIGAVAGVLAFYSARGFEKIGVDDPVYAFSVHGVAGIWGAIATGLLATPALAEKVGVGKAGLFYGGGWDQLLVQIFGVLGTMVFVVILSLVVLLIIKKVVGLRVTEEEELIGLDISEHGMYGYPEQMKSGNSSNIQA